MIDPSRVLHGLYAITDHDAIGATGMVAACTAALEGNARIIQYRDKHSDHARRYEDACTLARLCLAYDAILIINDDLALAQSLAAHYGNHIGLHIGRDDTSLPVARAALGQAHLIGVSCYNELALAHTAADAGADYVAFGSFFASPTKPEAAHADMPLLQSARTALSLPIVAIGGITTENGRMLIEAGADMLAVISDLWAAPDITAQARLYHQLFNS